MISNGRGPQRAQPRKEVAMENSKVSSLGDHRLKAISLGRQATVNNRSPSGKQKPKLLDQVRQAIRTRQYSPRVVPVV